MKAEEPRRSLDFMCFKSWNNSLVPKYHDVRFLPMWFLTLVESEHTLEKELHSPFLCYVMLCLWHLILFCVIRL